MIDPSNIGRVKVRVPSFHGIPDEYGKGDFMSTDDLPWAYPCFPIGSGYDHGTFILPEVGDYVFVTFEASSKDKLVYIGSSYGTNSDKPKLLGSYSDNYFSKTYAGSSGKWFSESGKTEIPTDIDTNSNQIATKVVYKSPKGSTIIIDDEDESENLTLIDRGGQVISMSSPISKTYNTLNLARRGKSRVDNNDLPDELKGTGTIKIINNSGLSLIMEGNKLTISNCTTLEIDGDLVVGGTIKEGDQD